MALVVGVMAVVDHPRVLRRAQSQTVVVDRALADPTELTRYLEELLGAEVRAVSVQRLDLVNDTTWVDVRWTAPRTPRRGARPARPAVLPDDVPPLAADATPLRVAATAPDGLPARTVRA